MKRALLIIYILSLAAVLCCSRRLGSHATGAYLGQKEPGSVPEIFAAGFFGGLDYVRDAMFTPDCREFYFTVLENGKYSIYYSRADSNGWTAPETASFSGGYDDFEPCVSPDGRRLFFASKRPYDQKPEMENDIDLWVMERTDSGWSDPVPLSGTINTRCMEYFPSVTSEGTLYFGRNDSALTRGDIYRSRNSISGFTEPEILPRTVNLPSSSYNAYIDPDEKFILFSSGVQEDSTWHGDLFVSFRLEDGTWSRAVGLGGRINSKKDEFSPWFSRDGRFLFYSSFDGKSCRIWWVSAKVIDEVRRR